MVEKIDDYNGNELELTADEKRAKDFLYHLLMDGSMIECDSDAKDIVLQLPAWYDVEKFKRGQKYFRDNRFGILNSNMYGLLSAISEPKGGKILDSTGKSSTPKTARKRYIQTLKHMIMWYDHDLEPGSKSWNSLELVRKMHCYASKSATKEGIGIISVTETGLTAYGFMGYALTRAHTLGITQGTQEDQEAFIFFWAVICAMLGVPDEYNMCLHSYEVVYIICEMIRQYVFMQILQLETPLFHKLARAYYDGMKEFLPFSSFESVLFNTKRVAGIPGYQFEVDLEKEHIPKALFSEKEISALHEHFVKQQHHKYLEGLRLDGKIRLLDIRRKDSNNNGSQTEIIEKYTYLEASQDEKEEEKKNEKILPLLEELGLESPDEVQITVIPDEDFRLYLNDSSFHKLSFKDQTFVKLMMHANRNNTKWWGHWINDKLAVRIINKMDSIK